MAVGYSSRDAARVVTQYLIDPRYRPLGYIGAWPKDNDRERDRRRRLFVRSPRDGVKRAIRAVTSFRSFR